MEFVDRLPQYIMQSTKQQRIVMARCEQDKNMTGSLSRARRFTAHVSIEQTPRGASPP
jgi:hypothetical protein